MRGLHSGMAALALVLLGPACADDDACAAGACAPAAVDAGSDAGDAADASDGDAQAPHACEPGEERACYSGPRETRDRGACRAGTQSCRAAGDGFGPCEGEVVPADVDACDDDVDGDCNGHVNDGFPLAASCACTPGADAACYTGPAASENVGPCRGGTRTCEPDGRAFGACEDERLPLAAQCSSRDDDCNGQPDGEQDLDGDGFTTCDGDCCDSPLDGCEKPSAHNPAAFDFPDNALDEDCSGDDDERVTCDDALASDSADTQDFARALDFCAAEHGFVSLGLSLADGTGTPAAAQHALRTNFGAIAPRVGASFVVLSTGHAADTQDTQPAYAGGSTSLATESDPPADWLLENFNAFPTLPDCTNGPSTRTYDPIMLTLRVRAPSNAQAFALEGYFLTTEYPEWVCTDYFDLFVALIDSSYGGQPRNPRDHNLASFVAENEQRYAVSVNLAQADSGLMRACENGVVGCNGGQASVTEACVDPADLVGTGLELQSGGCEDNARAGAGTGWFRMQGNVRPGETFELRLALWDAGDALLDSTVLLDGFTWLAERVEPGITP